MLAGERPSSDEGDRYDVKEALNLPAPIQKRIPIMIGGSGPKVTLRLVAQYADMNNLGNPIETIERSDPIMREHCERLGRDEKTIERTTEIQMVIIRDSRDEAVAVAQELLARGETRPGSGHVPTTRLVAGDSDEVAEQLKPFVEFGYRHLICGFPAPYDEETMRRLATEVRPALEALV